MPYSPKWSALTLVTIATSARCTRQAATQQAAARGFEHGRLAPARRAAPRARRPGRNSRRPRAALAVDEHAVGAAVAGAPAVRAQHRREQAHGRGLAVGTGDQRDRDRRAAPPSRPSATRATHRAATLRAPSPSPIESTSSSTSTGSRALARRARAAHQRRLRFGARERAQRVAARPRPRPQVRRTCRRAARRPSSHARASSRTRRSARSQRPFVDFGGGEQLVERRRERERGAAGVRARDDRAHRASRARARMRDARVASAAARRRRRRAADGFQHRAGAGEVQVGAGQAARVLERQSTHDVALSRSPRAPKRTPRSSRTTPSESPRPARFVDGRSPAPARSARPASARRVGGVAFGPELDDLLPRAHQRVGEDQQQVAGLAHAQRGVDRLLLVGDHR